MATESVLITTGEEPGLSESLQAGDRQGMGDVVLVEL